MRLTVSSNIDEVFKDIDAFMSKARDVAMPRAINALAAQAQVAGLRKVASVLGIGPRTTERYLTVRLATAGSLKASIQARGPGFPLHAFKPRQTKAGVTVQVRGNRFLIPHAFIKRMRSGHVGIFARGAYGGKSKRFQATGASFGRFRFSKTRLSINELYTLGPADAMSDPEVVRAMQDRIDEQAAAVIAREMRYANLH